MKRWISWVLSLCLVLSLALPAMAAEEATPEIDENTATEMAAEEGNTEPERLPDDEAPAYNGDAPAVLPDSAAMDAAESADPAIFVENELELPREDDNISEPAADGYGDYAGENITWNVTDGVLTISGEGPMANFGAHSAPWYSQSAGITSLVVSEGVTTLGRYAFYRLENLESVQLPDSLVMMDERAFEQCLALKSIEIPDNVTSVGILAFYGCSSLETVTIGDAVQTLNERAFEGCTALETVNFGQGLLRVGHSAFRGCTALRSMTIPDSVTTLENFAFAECAQLQSVSISSSVEYLSAHLFESCRALTTVEIPDSVSSVMYACFKGCTALEEIRFPENLALIAGSAFEGCNSLRAVYLPKSLISIDGYAFMNCSSLEELHYNGSEGLWKTVSGSHLLINYVIHCVVPELPASGTFTNDILAEFSWTLNEQGVLTVEGEGALPAFQKYENSSGRHMLPPWVEYLGLIRKVVIGDGISVIGSYTFYDCDTVTELTLPDGLTAIEDYAFLNCDSLAETVFPASLERVGKYAFSGTGLKSLAIPGTVSALGAYAFSEISALEEVSFSADLILGEGVFKNCDALVRVSLAEGITALPDFAFYDCDALASLQLPSTLQSIGIRCFDGCGKLTAAPLPDSILSIGGMAFSGCDLRQLSIPASVQSIGGSAFQNNLHLAAVTLPFVAEMGAGVFNGCAGMTSAALAEGWTELPDTTFDKCVALSSVRLPSTLVSIGENALRNCEALKSIVFPAGLTSIGCCAFSSCGLTTLSLPDGLETIDNGAFQNNDFKHVSVPGSVRAVGASVFAYCDKLKTATFEEGVTSIGGGCFYECGQLTAINLPSTIEILRSTLDFPAAVTLTVAADPDGKRSFLGWIDDAGFVYTSEQIVAGADATGSLTALWTLIWNGYDDVPEGSWYYDYVRYCYENGLMQGMDDSHFAPNGSATRAQVVMVLYRIAGEPTVSESAAFTDVAESSWYHDAVVWAAAEGIALGNGDGTFLPNHAVTREQFLVFLYRFADSLGLIINDWDGLYHLDSEDASSVSSWAMDAEVWSLVVGLQTGYEESGGGYTVRPASLLTRAELATFLARYASNVVLYYMAELAESLCGYTADDVLSLFGTADEVEEVDAQTRYWYYEDVGLVLEIRWYAEESVWYQYDWWWA